MLCGSGGCFRGGSEAVCCIEVGCVTRIRALTKAKKEAGKIEVETKVEIRVKVKVKKARRLRRWFYLPVYPSCVAGGAGSSKMDEYVVVRFLWTPANLNMTNLARSSTTPSSSIVVGSSGFSRG